jgi:hydrogenase maturation factor
MLAPGKLPGAFLADLLQILPTNDPNLILGPSVGEDAAVIDFAPSQDYLLVVKTDPITFATDEIGYYAVNVCANDLAVTGARPRFYLATVLLPATQADTAMVERIFRQIGDACRQLNISVAGGHSEITRTVSQPVVAGTLLGEVRRGHVLRTGGAQPGDLILLAGSAAIEGVSIIAREMRSQLLACGWSTSDLDVAANYLHDPGISVMTPALLAADRALVAAMHDPTEGGIATGLLELAVAADAGLAIDLDAIVVSELAVRLCAEFGLDPLGTIASGALLATARERDVARLQQLWAEHSWPSAVIGRVTPKEEGLSAYRAGRPVEFPRFPVDEITKLWV